MNKKWKIVFLIYADFRTNDTFSMSEDMKIEINSMLRDIITTPLDPDRSSLYVLFNSIKYIYKNNDGKFVLEDKAILYEIANTEKGLQNQIINCHIIENENFEIDDTTLTFRLQQKEKLIKALKEIDVFQDEDVFLVTWDHGSAFGIFRQLTFSISLNLRTRIFNDLDKFPYLRLFWNIAESYVKFHEFIENGKTADQYKIISLGHDLFKLSESDTANSLINFISDTTHRKAIEIKNSGVNKVKLSTKRVAGDIGVSNHKNELFEGIDSIDISEGIIEEHVILNKEGVMEILSNEELAESIYGWLGNKRVGVLLMMNCWMMNMHTIYALKERIDCLIAPQGDISNPGYNYKDILRFINKPSDFPVSAIELSEFCVASSYNDRAFRKAKKLNPSNPLTIDEWAIIAMNLQAISMDSKNRDVDIFLNLLHEIIEAMVLDLRRASELMYMIKYTRYFAFDFSLGKCFQVDILNWFLSMKRADISLDGKGLIPVSIIQKINRLIEISKPKNDIKEPGFVIAKSPAPQVYNKTYGAITYNPPTGFSLFFPFRKFVDIKLEENVKKDGLLNCYLSNWKELITLVYKTIILP